MPVNLSNNCIPNEEIPVLLTIFNRPDKARMVIENIRQIKPSKLFVAADGPRCNNPHDIEKCRLTRQEVTTVDWSCDIKTRFLDYNMGCDPAVSAAIDWFFQNVECGIILEDDCIISPQFFRFCGELLERYADDQRIMQISSLSPYPVREHPYDYHFSRIFRCSGGWGTWRRAWNHFTSDMNRYDDKEAFVMIKACQVDYWYGLWLYKKLMQFKRGCLIKPYWAHWDFQWNLACSAQNGLSIVPEKNLMINIGFDEDSTNTKNAHHPIFEDLQIQNLRFPLRHPTFIYADNRPERSLEKRIYRSLPLKSRCMYLLRRVLGASYYLRERMPYG